MFKKPDDLGRKAENEDAVTPQPDLLNQQAVNSASTVLDANATGFGSQVQGLVDGRRPFQPGDQVRVVGPDRKTYGKVGVVKRASRDQTGRFSVDLPDEPNPVRYRPEELQFDISQKAKSLFDDLVAKKTGSTFSFLTTDQAAFSALSREDWANMHTDIPPSWVQQIWDDTGGIPIRYTQDANIPGLIIGCGNTPTQQGAIMLSHDAHPLNIYTVDPNIEFGPTVLGLFGHDPVHRAFLQNNFTAINFDGYTPLVNEASLTAQPHFLEALDYLLADQGRVGFTIGPPTNRKQIFASKLNSKLIIEQEAEVPAEWVGSELTADWLVSTLLTLAA